jgi:hypothetical protein
VDRAAKIRSARSIAPQFQSPGFGRGFCFAMTADGVVVQLTLSRSPDSSPRRSQRWRPIGACRVHVDRRSRALVLAKIFFPQLAPLAGVGQDCPCVTCE